MWAGGTLRTGTQTTAAGSRRWSLFVPDGLVRPAPLLVMLHGCTQDAADFAAGTRMNEHARRHGLLVAYPEQAQQANPSRCWNWFEAAHQARRGGEPELIAGITGEIMAGHGVDPDRVYVAGLSAGAAMAVILGVTHPELYRAVGAHSGLAFAAARNLPGALQAMRNGPASDSGPSVPVDLGTARAGWSGGRRRPATSGVAGAETVDTAASATLPTPTIVVHGDADGTVHPRNGEEILRAWTHPSTGSGAPEVTRHHERAPGRRSAVRTTYTGAAGRPLAEHLVVHGLGHAWSGGDAAGSHTDPAGPDASAAMLRFFARVAAG